MDKRTENSPNVEPSMKACSVDETDEREISATPSSTGQKKSVAQCKHIKWDILALYIYCTIQKEGEESFYFY